MPADPPNTPLARARDPWYLSLVRIPCALIFLLGVFILPPGDRLWPAAMVIVFGPWVLSGRRLPLAAPSALWLGLGIFAGVIQFLGYPYRPPILLAVMLAAIAAAYAILARRARAAGMEKKWITLGLAGSLTLALATALLGWSVLAPP